MNAKDALVRFGIGMQSNLRLWVTQLIIDAENKMPGKTGKEKRIHVVEQLDAMVKLPWYAEPFDAPLFGLIVDAVCDKLNLLTDKQFKTITTKQAAKVSAVILDVAEDEIKETAAITLSVDERINELYKKYGIK